VKKTVWRKPSSQYLTLSEENTPITGGIRLTHVLEKGELVEEGGV